MPGQQQDSGLAAIAPWLEYTEVEAAVEIYTGEPRPNVCGKNTAALITPYSVRSLDGMRLLFRRIFGAPNDPNGGTQRLAPNGERLAGAEDETMIKSVIRERNERKSQDYDFHLRFSPLAAIARASRPPYDDPALYVMEKAVGSG